MRLQLEAFLGRWRACLQPKHALLFSQLNGAPMTVTGVYKVFQTSAFRISGKKTNPHLVRDMVVTHLRCLFWLRSPHEQRTSCPVLPPPQVPVGCALSTSSMHCVQYCAKLRRLLSALSLLAAHIVSTIAKFCLCCWQLAGSEDRTALV